LPPRLAVSEALRDEPDFTRLTRAGVADETVAPVEGTRLQDGTALKHVARLAAGGLDRHMLDEGGALAVVTKAPVTMSDPAQMVTKRKTPSSNSRRRRLKSRDFLETVVDGRRIELLTSALRTRRSPS